MFGWILKFLTGISSALFRVRANEPPNSGDLFMKLIESTKEKIHIISGELNSKFYAETFGISECLKDAAKRGVEIEIVVGPKPDKQSIKVLSNIEGIKITQIKTRPLAHFMVLDKNVRIEEYHQPHERRRKAYIVRNSTFLHDKLESEFSRLRQEQKLKKRKHKNHG